jgi:hypothetical protein
MSSNISKYFEGFSELNSNAQKYLETTLSFFDKCGFIGLLVKYGKHARLDDLGERLSIQENDYSVFDRTQFEREIAFFQKFGAFMAIPNVQKPLIEVRLNLVVAHEMAHQIQMLVQEKWLDQFVNLYNERHQACKHTVGMRELIVPAELDRRHFITGYASLSPWEFFAESFCCFAVRDAHLKLRALDRDVHEHLCELFHSPENMFEMPWNMTLASMRAFHKVDKESVLKLLGDGMASI